jgi:hypothetical protein
MPESELFQLKRSLGARHVILLTLLELLYVLHNSANFNFLLPGNSWKVEIGLFYSFTVADPKNYSIATLFDKKN